MTFLPPPLLPGRPAAWQGPVEELERCVWRVGDPAEPGALLAGFLEAHGLAGEPATQRGSTAVGLLLGAAACARLGGVPDGAPSPVPGVPDLVAVAVRQVEGGRAGAAAPPAPVPPPHAAAGLAAWQRTWTDAQHAAAVRTVREAIGRGDVYQANVVGHRRRAAPGDPAGWAAAVAALPARYAGLLCGDGWAVGSASPEQLVRVQGTRITTEPIKGTSRDAAVLRDSGKDRAEHVMIVDLERNDLARVARTGSVEVERLYDLAPWSDLWHAGSTVAAELLPGTGPLDVLRALVPGGSVTGAPKHAACGLLGGIEPVGRGPSMGAFGTVFPGGLDLGLTIRTVAVADGEVHLWAGGGITWGSDPQAEVAEAEAKARPVVAALDART